MFVYMHSGFPMESQCNDGYYLFSNILVLSKSFHLTAVSNRFFVIKTPFHGSTAWYATLKVEDHEIQSWTQPRTTRTNIMPWANVLAYLQNPDALQNPLPSSVFKVAWKLTSAFKLTNAHEKNIKDFIYLGPETLILERLKNISAPNILTQNMTWKASNVAPGEVSRTIG